MIQGYPGVFERCEVGYRTRRRKAQLDFSHGKRNKQLKSLQSLKKNTESCIYHTDVRLNQSIQLLLSDVWGKSHVLCLCDARGIWTWGHNVWPKPKLNILQVQLPLTARESTRRRWSSGYRHWEDWFFNIFFMTFHGDEPDISSPWRIHAYVCVYLCGNPHGHHQPWLAQSSQEMRLRMGCRGWEIHESCCCAVVKSKELKRGSNDFTGTYFDIFLIYLISVLWRYDMISIHVYDELFWKVGHLRIVRPLHCISLTSVTLWFQVFVSLLKSNFKTATFLNLLDISVHTVSNRIIFLPNMSRTRSKRMFLPQRQFSFFVDLLRFAHLSSDVFKTWIDHIFCIVGVIGVILDPEIFARQRAFYAKRCPFYLKELSTVCPRFVYDCSTDFSKGTQCQKDTPTGESVTGPNQLNINHHKSFQKK